MKRSCSDCTVPTLMSPGLPRPPCAQLHERLLKKYANHSRVPHWAGEGFYTDLLTPADKAAFQKNASQVCGEACSAALGGMWVLSQPDRACSGQ